MTDVFTSDTPRLGYWGIARKLDRWRAHGLISFDQAQMILSFERTLGGTRLIRGLVGVGILAIVLGVLAIIAANWAAIPGGVKISAHVLINLVLAYAIYSANQKAITIIREGAVAGLFGLTLTLIILIGQVYQLHGSLSLTLSLWLIVTTPFMMIYGRTTMVSTAWYAAFLVTMGVIGMDLIKLFDNKFLNTIVVIIFSMYVPLACAAVATFPTVRKHLPTWSYVLTRSAMLFAIASATYCSLAWYVDMDRAMGQILQSSEEYLAVAFSDQLAWVILTALLLGPAILVYRLTRKLHLSDQEESLADLLSISIAFSSLPLVLAMPSLDIMSPIHFIGFWIIVACVAHRQNMAQLQSLAIYLIALRLIIVYVELFQSLLTTGIGLIISGVLLIAILYGVGKVRSALAITQDKAEGD